MISFLEKPHFEKELQDNEQLVGKQARFEASVTGLPNPDVVWMKDDKQLEPSACVSIENRGNVKILTLKKLDKDDIGHYTIKASNEAGEAFCSANLNVQGKNFHGSPFQIVQNTHFLKGSLIFLILILIQLIKRF